MTLPLRILLVEDERQHAELISRAFRKKSDPVELTVASSLKEAFLHLEKYAPDLIITDWRLPDGLGMRLLAMQHRDEPLPVVVMTSHGSEQVAVEAMKSGAMDYVVKSDLVLADMPHIAERALKQWESLTEWKKAEEALRKSEEKFSKAFKNSPLWVVISALDTGLYIDVNDAFLRTTGFEREEVIGRSSVALGTWVDSGQRDEMMRILKEEGAVKNREVLRLTKSGRPLTMLFSAELIEFEDQPCLVAISQDITEFKVLEAGFRQAQKMEAVGRLAGGVAHDFNNILQAIAGYVQLLSLRREAFDQDLRYLQEIDRSITRAAELVRQLLTLSREVESKKRNLDLNVEVAQDCRLLERTLPKMIEIELDLTEYPLPVFANSTQLEQILLNLATNAADAMPRGGRLTIKTGQTEITAENAFEPEGIISGRYACLTVKDTGHGIKPEIINHIFEPFFTTKDVGQGTGLGLATVYGILKEHGGFIRVDSRVSGGTSFNLYIPWAKTPLIPIQEQASESPPCGGDETILLVDDEKAIRESGRDVLGHFGFNVLTAASGEEALELVKKGFYKIDLTILDINMPGMGGYQCLKELLCLEPDLKVLIASGCSVDTQAPEVMESGAMGFIPKPYRISDLIRQIRLTIDSD